MSEPISISIKKLHPTQLTLGMAEVKKRAKMMRELTHRELDQLLRSKPVPYVKGPKGRLYLIDHHHLCRALVRIGHDDVYLGACHADYSHLPLHEFWEQMLTARLCWPIDAEGNRRPCVKIPDDVEELTDNPWRTLARGVRGRAYSNEDTPFQEFMWGNYFRSFMTTRLLETDIEAAEDLAVTVSKFDEAQDLPGYLG